MYPPNTLEVLVAPFPDLRGLCSNRDLEIWCSSARFASYRRLNTSLRLVLPRAPTEAHNLLKFGCVWYVELGGSRDGVSSLVAIVSSLCPVCLYCFDAVRTLGSRVLLTSVYQDKRSSYLCQSCLTKSRMRKRVQERIAKRSGSCRCSYCCSASEHASTAEKYTQTGVRRSDSALGTNGF